MNRPTQKETKLVICAWQPFTEWQAKPLVAETLRRRWPEMRVAHAPTFTELPPELPDTDIFVGAFLLPKHLQIAKKLKWIHSTSAGVGQLTYPELLASGVVVTNASGVFSVPMANTPLVYCWPWREIFPIACASRTRKSGRSKPCGTNRST